MSKPNDKFIVDINVYDTQKRYQPSKHYVYSILVTWSDQSKHIIYRRYSQFFDLQCKLLDNFSKDAGSSNPDERILPFLPGKIIFGRSNIKSVALDRLFPLNSYCKKLISLKKEISACDLVIEFFQMNNDDIEQSVKGHNRDKKPDTANENDISISSPLKSDEYLVIHGFKATSKSELSIQKNSKVFVVDKNLNGWWFVQNKDGQGYVPGNCLRKMNSDENELKPIKVEMAEPHIVTSDFKATKADEITVKKASYVLVIEKNLNGFWKIKMNDKEGLVPAVFLRPHTLLNEKLKETLNLLDTSSDQAVNGSVSVPEQQNNIETTLNANNDNDKEETVIKEKPDFYYSIDKYTDNAGDGVSLQRGQRVSVLRKDNTTNWWYVKLDDSREGWAPGTYLIKKLPENILPIAEENLASTASTENVKIETNFLQNKGNNSENTAIDQSNENSSKKITVNELRKLFDNQKLK